MEELSLGDAGTEGGQGAGRALLERCWQAMEMTPEKAGRRVWSETEELTLPEARSLSRFGPAGRDRWHTLAVQFLRMEVFGFHQSHPGCVQSHQSCGHDGV